MAVTILFEPAAFRQAGDETLEHRSHRLCHPQGIGRETDRSFPLPLPFPADHGRAVPPRARLRLSWHSEARPGLAWRSPGRVHLGPRVAGDPMVPAVEKRGAIGQAFAPTLRW